LANAQDQSLCFGIRFSGARAELLDNESCGGLMITIVIPEWFFIILAVLVVMLIVSVAMGAYEIYLDINDRWKK